VISLHFLTPFSAMIEAVIGESILGRAAKKGHLQYTVYDLFKYADPPHYKIDDYPFGGGTGMVMKPEPIFRAFDDVKNHLADAEAPRVVFPTPDGQVLNHDLASSLAESSSIVFINGHYKGIDQRVRDQLVTDEISIGDYVLTGGELPALIILDAMVRLVPGVLNSIESAQTDSFTSGRLDYSHYTRSEVYRELKVPDILLSGHHRKIADWRLDEQKTKTKQRRSDLWDKYQASQELE